MPTLSAAKGTPAALDVARLFLSWANRDGDVITNLKMQKLLYYAQAWYLVNFGKPLFGDRIEAWDLGPVVPVVYRAFKANGPRPIDYRDQKGAETVPFTPRQLDYLKEFYRAFARFSAHELVNMSHNESPWVDAYKTHSEITPDSMRSFYKKLSVAKK